MTSFPAGDETPFPNALDRNYPPSKKVEVPNMAPAYVFYEEKSRYVVVNARLSDPVAAFQPLVVPGSVNMFVEREDRWRDMSYEEVMDRMAQKGKKGSSGGKGKGGNERVQGRDEDPMPSRDLIWALGLRMQHGGDRLFTDEEHRKSLDRLLEIQVACLAARLTAKERELPLVEEPLKQQYRYALRLWRELSLRIGPSPPPPDVPVRLDGENFA
ncbi:hypothetical protein AK812_SmicGene34637 [Symbiodinium microadriaticum]|uniref:Uncharacterized protein n=1 Tax=Symbiodinium microadriaticum TaxID=2951 RepID=A0A1Q9CNI3_SYMMI|nr:hypothetical protein AK812_SmicGene34637 [Symbiodinium microadriaticum]